MTNVVRLCGTKKEILFSVPLRRQGNKAILIRSVADAGIATCLLTARAV